MTDLYYIEDDPDIACTVKEYLEQKGFAVTICATLAQAKHALKTHVPALVLLDWNMPDGRGDSMCRWIRGGWKELPKTLRRFWSIRNPPQERYCSDTLPALRSSARIREYSTSSAKGFTT